MAHAGVVPCIVQVWRVPHGTVEPIPLPSERHVTIVLPTQLDVFWTQTSGAHAPALQNSVSRQSRCERHCTHWYTVRSQTSPVAQSPSELQEPTVEPQPGPVQPGPIEPSGVSRTGFPSQAPASRPRTTTMAPRVRLNQFELCSCDMGSLQSKSELKADRDHFARSCRRYARLPQDNTTTPRRDTT